MFGPGARIEAVWDADVRDSADQRVPTFRSSDTVGQTPSGVLVRPAMRRPASETADTLHCALTLPQISKKLAHSSKSRRCRSYRVQCASVHTQCYTLSRERSGHGAARRANDPAVAISKQRRSRQPTSSLAESRQKASHYQADGGS